MKISITCHLSNGREIASRSRLHRDRNLKKIGKNLFDAVFDEESHGAIPRSPFGRQWVVIQHLPPHLWDPDGTYPLACTDGVSVFIALRKRALELNTTGLPIGLELLVQPDAVATAVRVAV